MVSCESTIVLTKLFLGGDFMGRKNKKYTKTMHQQAYEKFNAMQAFGESRAEGKKNGEAAKKIYSFSTRQTYWKQTKKFIKWVNKNHPECTTLKKAKKYINEWLQEQVEAEVSAWTISTRMAALYKLYEIPADDPNRIQAPERRRRDIKRSRVDAVRDKHFSVTNNDELIKFVRATGTRRNVLERLKGDDLWTRERMAEEISRLEVVKNLSNKDQKHLATLKDALEVFPNQHFFIHHRKDKGGRSRFAPIIGPHAYLVIDRFKNTDADELVWQHVHSGADIHGYRGDYATMLYKLYARAIKDIPYDRINQGTGKRFQGDVYACRKDEKGKKLDKRAMRKCSKGLGHNRLSVVADHYLRGI